jgi:hypothetical protein
MGLHSSIVSLVIRNYHGIGRHYSNQGGVKVGKGVALFY